MGFNADVSKNEQGGALNGFFSRKDVVGMLETFDKEAVDMEAPFPGAISYLRPPL